MKTSAPKSHEEGKEGTLILSLQRENEKLKIENARLRSKIGQNERTHKQTTASIPHSVMNAKFNVLRCKTAEK